MGRKFKLLILIAPCLCFFQIDKAAAGSCGPDYQAMEFSLSFNKEYNNPSDNPAAGTVLPNVYTWDLGGFYNAICICNGQSTLEAGVYYTTTTPFPYGERRLVNGQTIQFYQISPYVQAGVEMFISGARKQYVATPWEKAFNFNSSLIFTCYRDTVRMGIETGSKGRLHLLISRPFVGTLHLPRFLLLNLYGASQHADSPLKSPIMKLYMSLSVTVPQNCTLAAGQQTTFDFGTLSPGSLAELNGPAKHAVNRTFRIQCTNIAAETKINVSLEGQPAQQDPLHLSSSHPDVTLKLASNGRPVAPTTPGFAPAGMQLVPFELDPQSQSGLFNLEAWPVRMKPLPTPGAFQGSATIRFDYE